MNLKSLAKDAVKPSRLTYKMFDHPPVAKEGRVCKRCKCYLSIYNSQSYCSPCRGIMLEKNALNFYRHQKKDRIIGD